MQRKLSRIFGYILFAIVVVMILPNFVKAYSVFGYRLNGGVGNYGFNTRNYWVDSSASSYTTYIDNAVSTWVFTTSRLGITTPISLTRTTSKSSSYFDVYDYTLPGSSNTVAGTYFYVKNVGCINPNFEGPNQNYSWTEIILNDSSFANLSAFNGLTRAENQQGTIAHEFGHAMGLAHSNSNEHVIMCQLSHDRDVYIPTADDLNGINLLY